jgi:hypothetical protein
MATCSFGLLVALLDKRLGLDDQLDTFDHLDSCDICRDAVYQIARDRDAEFFRHRLYVFDDAGNLRNVA